ncbi:PPOX class F420-dependent oxidoreductase [Pseudonocardia endophytica]|uniref:PPOX class probable F420-dependent enzyme n=1 Tax=Pseudonocardia endophytica TaxID=401976 RepID=A0A4R1HL52_PSEEN|nr:PPOX class F420-dependent oxidoreductase [Pseudonocardia endophytica]TCK21030.1 PPOX class probable F420-dependent enzyme [Pseudonocardia endophytica]
MTDTATLTPEVVEFLNHGTRTGMLGWTASDGRPLVAPVWFLAEDGTIVFNTGGGTAKAKAVARDPRVVLTADLSEPPYAFVQVQGVAEIVEDLDEVRRVATELGGRYMGAARAEEFGERNGVPGEIVVRIRPTKVNASLDMTA